MFCIPSHEWKRAIEANKWRKLLVQSYLSKGQIESGVN